MAGDLSGRGYSHLMLELLCAPSIFNIQPFLLVRAAEGRVADGDFVVAVDEGGKIAAGARARDKPVNVSEKVFGAAGPTLVVAARIVGVFAGRRVEQAG